MILSDVDLSNDQRNLLMMTIVIMKACFVFLRNHKWEESVCVCGGGTWSRLVMFLVRNVPKTHISVTSRDHLAFCDIIIRLLIQDYSSGSIHPFVYFFFFLQISFLRPLEGANLHRFKFQCYTIYLFFNLSLQNAGFFFGPALKSSVSSPPKRCLCTAQINRNPELQCFICHGLNFSKSGIYK